MAETSPAHRDEPPPIYRFRSLEHLLDTHQELRRQEIYFAHLDELGDPREHEQDIVWRSDETAWRSLLRNYLYALYHVYRMVQTTGHAVGAGAAYVDPSGRTRLQLTDIDSTAAECAWQALWDDHGIQTLFMTIGAYETAVRHNELLRYLIMVHPVAIASIEQAHAQHRLPTVGTAPLMPNRGSTGHVFAVEHHARLLARLDGEDDFESDSERALQFVAGHRFVQRYRTRHVRESMMQRNLRFLRHDFPVAFVSRLSTPLGPERYTACFSKNCSNATMWTRYADGHTGVCLIFRPRALYGRWGIELEHPQASRWDAPPGLRAESGGLQLPFYDIVYRDATVEVDFFRNLGALQPQEVYDWWHSDEAGSVSVATLIQQVDMTEEPIELWPSSYWYLYLRNAATKSTDWEHEQETRLILPAPNDGNTPPVSRLLEYDFRSLAGIIFGINTDEESKFRIIEIVEQKQRQGRCDSFRFYQACYSHAKKGIDHYELPWNEPMPRTPSR